MSKNIEYAVVDIETTGFSPRKHDRIVEIAIVRVDGRNNVLGEYDTLVNPMRDVGPTYLHGITAADVQDAPTFEEVVGDVIELMRGAVFVAHNVPFDLRFLTHECQLSGAPMPPNACLCTLSMARCAWPEAPNHKLGCLCEFLKLDGGRQHSALDDAKAAAALLWACQCGVACDLSGVDALGMQGRLAPPEAWPTIPPSGRRHRRCDAAGVREQCRGQLARLFDRLPARNDTNYACDAYLQVLEQALQDRHISDDELAALWETAQTLDMDQEEIRAAHRTFLRDLVRVAMLDQVITDAEKREIEEVAGLLDVPTAEYECLIKQALEAPAAVSEVRSCPELHGKSVCFTGQFNLQLDGKPIARRELENLATNCGMTVKVILSGNRNPDALICQAPIVISSRLKSVNERWLSIPARDGVSLAEWR